MALFLHPQEANLLSALNQCCARYIVIGGHAVQFHGHLRPARDLDIWIEPTAENARRVSHALTSAGIFLTPEQVVRLGQPHLQMPIPGLYTEFLTSAQGLEFSEAMARSVSTTEHGVPCHVLSRADLIHNKRALGRESDLEDIENLEKLAQ